MLGTFFRELGDVVGRSVDAIPFGRQIRGITPSSPLDLFDSAAAMKMEPGWYFKGQSLNIKKIRSRGKTLGVHGLTEPDASLASKRKWGWGIAGGVLGASVLGFDPLGATTAASEAGKLGFHLGVGGTMFNLGGKTRLLGVGYLGLGAANMFRSGDNVGPY